MLHIRCYRDLSFTDKKGSVADTADTLVQKLAEAATRRCSAKKLFWKMLQTSREKTWARVSFLTKLQAETCNFIKNGTLSAIFFSNICFYKTHAVALSLSLSFSLSLSLFQKSLLLFRKTFHLRCFTGF